MELSGKKKTMEFSKKDEQKITPTTFRVREVKLDKAGLLVAFIFS